MRRRRREVREEDAKENGRVHVSLSPCLLVSVSPCPLVSLSLSSRVFAFFASSRSPLPADHARLRPRRLRRCHGPVAIPAPPRAGQAELRAGGLARLAEALAVGGEEV